MLEDGAIALPEINSFVMRANHDTHALRLSVETRVFKKTPHEICCVVRPHIQPNQTICRMTQRGIEEIPIQGKERHAALPMQQWNDVGVFHAESGDVLPDEPEGNVPLLQQR